MLKWSKWQMTHDMQSFPINQGSFSRVSGLQVCRRSAPNPSPESRLSNVGDVTSPSPYMPQHTHNCRRQGWARREQKPSCRWSASWFCSWSRGERRAICTDGCTTVSRLPLSGAPAPSPLAKLRGTERCELGIEENKGIGRAESGKKKRNEIRSC